MLIDPEFSGAPFSLAHPLTDHVMIPKSRGKQGAQVAMILKDFDFQSCEAWKHLKCQFGDGIRHKELSSIASVLSSEFEIQGPSRDAQRSFPVLIKWFSDNWNEVEPFLALFTLWDENFEPINRSREIRDNHRSRRRSMKQEQCPPVGWS
jgi:hypothetical protein